MTEQFTRQQQLIENVQAALEDLNTAMQLHGPSSDVTAYYHLLFDRAHRELMAASNDQPTTPPEDDTPYFFSSPLAPILLALVAVVAGLAYASLIAWVFHTF